MSKVELAQEDAATVIGHLLEYLGAYIRENISLRETIAEQDRTAENYRRLIRDFDRQREAAR